MTRRSVLALVGVLGCALAVTERPRVAGQSFALTAMELLDQFERGTPTAAGAFKGVIHVESVKDDQELDPQFKSLLKHHWLEEVQHAKLDTLMVQSLAEGRKEKEIMEGVEEYLAIGGFIDGGLKTQVELDLDSFERAVGRELKDEQREEFRRKQLQANRWTYLGTGMTHEKVLATLEWLSPAARQKVESISPIFS